MYTGSEQVMKWTLGNWTRENRERLRWSQDVLAEKVGVTKSYISKIEGAVNAFEISRAVLDGLANAFGVPVYEVYEAAGFIRPAPEPESDVIILFHLKNGVPVQITDPEILTTTRKAVLAKTKTN